MDTKTLVYLMIGIALVIEVVMELVKYYDPQKRLKQWYSMIALGVALVLSTLCHLAALLHGVWALIFVVGLMAYALQHLFADAIVKRVRRMIDQYKA